MRFSFLLVGGYGPASAIGTCAHEFATGQELNGDHSSGNLNVGVLVQNIAFQKQVGIVYTTDNWLTFQNAFGNHTQSFPPPSTASAQC